MWKVCIWLGPAVVCLQIYCWSPAIYVPNERQNLSAPNAPAKAKNLGQIWAEQTWATKGDQIKVPPRVGAKALILSSIAMLEIA